MCRLFLFTAISRLFISTKIETVDGQTILTTDKPQEDESTGLIIYKDAETGAIKQINRDQIRRMVELDD